MRFSKSITPLLVLLMGALHVSASTPNEDIEARDLSDGAGAYDARDFGAYDLEERDYFDELEARDYYAALLEDLIARTPPNAAANQKSTTTPPANIKVANNKPATPNAQAARTPQRGGAQTDRKITVGTGAQDRTPRNKGLGLINPALQPNNRLGNNRGGQPYGQSGRPYGAPGHWGPAPGYHAPAPLYYPPAPAYRGPGYGGYRY